MKKIKAGNKAIFIVSDIDYNYLIQRKWYRVRAKRPGALYYIRNITYKNGKYINLMVHRCIMERIINRKLKKFELIDHINGNTLDNRRENLRIANYQESSLNTKSKNSKSGYKGVVQHSDGIRWKSICQINKKTIILGIFNTKKEAAIAYDIYCLQNFGDFVKLNFPNKKTKYLNLRYIRKITNRPKKRKRIGQSNYVGVILNKKNNKWISRINFNYKSYWLGTFKNEIDAARAYDKALVKFFGKGSEVNFPKKWAERKF